MQTVEIAKALAHQAGVIIMDEPTSAISGREAEALFAIIRDLTNHGAAVVYISHKMEEIFRLADTITVLRDGRHVATQPARDLDERGLISLMVGRELAPPTINRRVPGEPVLEICNLCQPGKFQDINLTLRRGEILGLAGLMGAGRTDLVHALLGLTKPAAGEIRIDSRVVRVNNPAAAFAAGIALVSEDRKRFGFVPRMSVARNITLAAARGWRIDHTAENALADGQIEALGIKVANRGQALVELSGGNQQKVVLAKALLTRPQVLILDEPTRGIDIGAKADIYTIIDRLARAGTAILLVSSELPELLSLCDRLLVMREGRLTAELDPRLTNQEEIMKFAMPA
jgi:ABC-type sugar transport system ATPase subunit